MICCRLAHPMRLAMTREKARNFFTVIRNSWPSLILGYFLNNVVLSLTYCSFISLKLKDIGAELGSNHSPANFQASGHDSFKQLAQVFSFPPRSARQCLGPSWWQWPSPGCSVPGDRAPASWCWGFCGASGCRA